MEIDVPLRTGRHARSNRLRGSPPLSDRTLR